MPRNTSGQVTSEQLSRADFENLLDKYLSGEISDKDLERRMLI